MMRLFTTHRLLFAALLAGAATHAAAGEATTDLGIEGEFGRSYLDSFNRAEVDKEGNGYGGQAFVRHSAWLGDMQFGLGLWSSTMEGSNRRRGVAHQDFDLKAGFADARYLFTLPLHLDLGVSVRDYFGKGADYDVQHSKSDSNAVAAGPVLGFTYPLGDVVVGANVAYYANLNKNDRQVQTIVGAVSLAYRFGGTKEAAKCSDCAKPAFVESNYVPVPVNFAEDIAHFDFAKSDIKPALRAKILRLGKALAAVGPSLGPITVSGHTDSRGPHYVNEPLSVNRANAVCDLLAQAGVSRSLLVCEGHADMQLLPQYPGTAAAQRRAAMVVIKIKASVAQELRGIIAEALAH